MYSVLHVRYDGESARAGWLDLVPSIQQAVAVHRSFVHYCLRSRQGTTGANMSHKVLDKFSHIAIISRTRRPCCRTEPSRDAEFLYRKLVPNPRATQRIERTLKLSANTGNLSKNNIAVVSVKD